MKRPRKRRDDPPTRAGPVGAAVDCDAYLTGASAIAFDFADRLIIGLGAQKAGTTWLARRIAAHPQVHAPVKEIHYWDDIRAPYRDEKKWRETLSKARYRLLAKVPLDWQRKKWTTSRRFRADACDHSGYVDVFRRGYAGQPVLFECTPRYALLSSAVIDEIAAIHRDTRFVFLMRDPVSRFWSGIRHFHRHQMAAGMSEASLVHVARIALEDPHDMHRRMSSYDETLRNPRMTSGQTHLAFFETLFARDSLDAITDFAGLSRIKLGKTENPNPSRFGQLAMPSDLAARAREVFTPTYDRVAEVMGDLPPAWHAHD